jgi:hypothetical protein
VVDMPRLETYVDDRTYIQLLQYKEQHSIRSNGQAAKRLLMQVFKQEKEQDQAVMRLNSVIQKLSEENHELKNHIKHLKMKMRVKE